ncbi:hypothetical protein HUG20_01340 [Salicibibacter cibi]|uniref:Antitoxin n=1 Tax=Salicibibacter cibi TaxID=2743001 RepID=A0A7T7CE53_9BACI|nr:hypothetical protein [Salicibibacter cibi]QQK78677.1 hypothetical protein HUG20_01340 [Salicibibacter cibi]
MTLIDNDRLFNVSTTKRKLSEILNSVQEEPAYIIKRDQVQAAIISLEELKRKDALIERLEEEVFEAAANVRALKAEQESAEWVNADEMVASDLTDNPYANLSDEELFD